MERDLDPQFFYDILRDLLSPVQFKNVRNSLGRVLL